MAMWQDNVKTPSSPYGYMWPQGSYMQRSGERSPQENRSESGPEILAGETAVHITTNMLWPSTDMVTTLVERLRPQELRWLVKDVMNASIVACYTNTTEDLASMLNGWVATAEIMIGARRRWRHILKARQEGRERFGGANTSV